MFKVTEKETDKTFDVYDITYDAVTGYPQFLIYKDGQWLRVSAKHYKPVELVDTLNIEDLKEQYESDSRSSRRRTKAWQDLREYIDKNNIDCSAEHFIYDFYTGDFKED